jgi:TonB family protein
MLSHMRSRILLAAFISAQFSFLSPSRAGPQAYIPEKYKGIILYAPEPDFPPTAQSQNTMGGQGVYRLVINQKTGTVDEVGVLRRSGFQPLDAVAVMTFFQWKFRPGTLKQLDVPVSFNRFVQVLLKNAGSR